MTRAELIERKMELKKRLKKYNELYDKTGDDDKYGLVIEATEDELKDVNDELEYDSKLRALGFTL